MEAACTLEFVRMPRTNRPLRQFATLNLVSTNAIQCIFFFAIFEDIMFNKINRILSVVRLSYLTVIIAPPCTQAVTGGRTPFRSPA